MIPSAFDQNQPIAGMSRKGAPVQGAPFCWSRDNFAAMQDNDLDGLRERLNAHHDWPSEYMFKFIAPNLPEKVDAILGLFPSEVRVERKTSGGDKYIALTIHETVADADAVFHRYRTVQALGGIFAL